MVSLVKLNNSAVKFVFTDSDHYLTGNGEIEVPVNSLSLVLDESEMVNFKKAANGDPFISFIATNSNLGTKAAIEQFYKENMVGGNSGGGGSGVTPSEVQSMIDESLEDYYTDDEVDAALSGKADTSAVTALENEVATKADTSAVTALENEVATKADTSALTATDNALSAHTSNTHMHVTSQDKYNWNNKAEMSAVTAVATDVSTLSGTVDDINDAIEEFDDKEQVIASALTQLRDDMDEKEEVVATALNDLNEAIGDPYQKVSGITIDSNNEGDVPSPFISIEKVEGSNSNYTYISSNGGLESTFENNTEGSHYSSYIGQGSIGNSATDSPDENVTSERSLDITTDGFRQTTDENYDDGESQYTRYSSSNEFEYSSGLQLHQYWYDEKSDSETNSYMSIVNNKEGDTYIEMTDTNERTVNIKPNMLSWDDGRDRGNIEWSSIATLNDIPEYSAGTGIEITDNVISVTGGTGSGMTSGDVETMIDAALDDYYDKDDVDAVLSGKADTSDVTAAIDAATSGKVDTSAITTSITSGSTDSEIPTAKAVYDAIPTGGGATYSAGTNISIDTGNTINCTLPITATTYGGIIINKSNNNAGTRAFAGGEGCNASGTDGFSFGVSNTASSTGSAAFGFKTNASVKTSFVCGKWNDIADANTGDNFGSSGNTVFAVGNGWKQNDWTVGTANTHNALDIRQNGDIYFSDTDNTTYANYYQKPMVRLQDMYVALGGLKFVKLTQSEYDNLATKDSSTLYIISD